MSRQTATAVLQRKCACGKEAAEGECASCRQKKVQRKATGPTRTNEAPPIVHEVLGSPGRPLDAGTREFMEPRFGHDFSRVQVHTDKRAADSARAVRALAYTVGQHMVFGMGQFLPDIPSGRKLITHELTHVVQQSGMYPTSPGKVLLTESGGYLEREAEAAGELLADPEEGKAVAISSSAPSLRRQAEPVEVDLSVVSPEEAQSLREQGVDLPKSNPDKWPLPLGKELELDRDRIIEKLKVAYYSDADEAAVMTILHKWAFEPNPLDRVNLLWSVYLEALFAQLQSKINNQGVTYYDQLFARSDDYQRELKELRNYRAPTFKSTADLKDEGLSYELDKDSPDASNVSTLLTGLTSDQKRVLGWLQDHKAEIVAAEAEFGVDRRAIAGAIAWEALENVRGSWTPSSVGPGKVHIRTHRIAGENTVAKQTEEAGYLPAQSFDERKKILVTASGAIHYIAAIMKAGTDIAWEERAFDISKQAEILTYFYQSKDLPAWRALMKANKAGEVMSPGDFKDNMGRWVQIHMPFLEEAVGQPSFTVTHPPKTESFDTPALQRSAVDNEPAPKSWPPGVAEVLQSQGRALDAASSVFMESRFGHDFSSVRVHNDAKAGESARKVNARAYTVGQDIVFGESQYNPNTKAGNELLAHELTHVVQQSVGSGIANEGEAIHQPDAYTAHEFEIQAEKTAHRVIAGELADEPLLPMRANVLQRAEKLGGRLTQPKGAKSAFKKITATFDGKDFVLLGDGAEILRAAGQSGRPNTVKPADAKACGGSPDDSYMNNPRYVGIADNGPIPEGEYTFQRTDMTMFNIVEQAVMSLAGEGAYVDPSGSSLHGDWGAGRTALRPVRIVPAKLCGNTGSRSGFYLHGGVMPGSSGCIDVGDDAIRSVGTALLGYRNAVHLIVKYTQPPPDVGTLDRAAGRFMYPPGKNPSFMDRLKSVFGGDDQ